MKRNAIVRIVLYSIALLALLTILGISFGIGHLSYIPSVFDTKNTEVDTATQTPVPLVDDDETISTRLDADDIRNLDIEWTAGNITILPVENTTQITVIEPKQSQEKYQMLCRKNGSTLSIEFWQKDIIRIHSNDISKDLTITVPADWVCQELDIETGSANVSACNLSIGSVEFEGASGICTFTDCIVDSMDMDTASGDIRFTGSLDKLECDAASASCHITVNNCPSRIDVSSMSGELDLTLPEDCGFTANVDAMSSEFSSDFQTTVSNGHHVYGDGSCRINVDAMAGDVTIRKGTTHHDEHH